MKNDGHIDLQWRRTKIIATLGPATRKPKQIEELLHNGANVIRLNMSHGDHDQHRENFARVRKAANKLGLHVPILMDLCGPKMRVGKFENDAIALKARQQVIVTTRKCVGTAGLIPINYTKLHQDIRPGERILLDDGNLELKALSVNGQDIKCRVIYGGELKNNKGFNMPDSTLSVPALTAKDKKDVELAVELGADYLALSFVRSGKDVATLNRLLKRKGRVIPVISKIERPEAVGDIDEVLTQSYAIMVARGDLGIELPAEQVPLIQKELIAKARQRYRPVIVATQMLESMVHNARPTRAEVGDVATAADSSTDAVMLSAETASGAHPQEAVKVMDRILREIEAYQWQRGYFIPDETGSKPTTNLRVRRAIARSVTSLARDLKLQGILLPTRTGTTARIIAASRPTAPCMGVCHNDVIARMLGLHWGVVPVRVEEIETHNWKELSHTIAHKYKLLRTGHQVLLVSGFSVDPAHNEPTMKLISV